MPHLLLAAVLVAPFALWAFLRSRAFGAVLLFTVAASAIGAVLYPAAAAVLRH